MSATAITIVVALLVIINFAVLFRCMTVYRHQSVPEYIKPYTTLPGWHFIVDVCDGDVYRAHRLVIEKICPLAGVGDHEAVAAVHAELQTYVLQDQRDFQMQRRSARQRKFQQP
ncbi:hypothetical protein PQR62_05385 [Herbaspirillum lusitanum]|uniref:Uncharacterized protein n=1 Tax=Herbaspirillum lusitanum TaxID=213312 RepID=A0ABW9A7E9_9BURK